MEAKYAINILKNGYLPTYNQVSKAICYPQAVKMW